jgi:ssDNA-binding Zn-finger/Zn-ribbon topoisomerase 1
MQKTLDIEAAAALSCPICGAGPMIQRSGTNGIFWGCRNFGRGEGCRGSRQADGRPGMNRRPPQLRRDPYGNFVPVDTPPSAYAVGQRPHSAGDVPAFSAQDSGVIADPKPRKQRKPRESRRKASRPPEIQEPTREACPPVRAVQEKPEASSGTDAEREAQLLKVRVAEIVLRIRVLEEQGQRLLALSRDHGRILAEILEAVGGARSIPDPSQSRADVAAEEIGEIPPYGEPPPADEVPF